MNWRENLDFEVKEHIEELIEEVHKNSSAYKLAKNPSNAQLWCALGILSKKFSKLNKYSPKLKKTKKNKLIKAKNIKAKIKA